MVMFLRKQLLATFHYPLSVYKLKSWMSWIIARAFMVMFLRKQLLATFRYPSMDNEKLLLHGFTLFIDDNLFVDGSDDFWEQCLAFISGNRISLHT